MTKKLKKTISFKSVFSLYINENRDDVQRVRLLPGYGPVT